MQQYEAAALVHDHAAEFWERHGKPEKATVERERVELDRFYADFEAERLRRSAASPIKPPRAGLSLPREKEGGPGFESPRRLP